MDVASSAGAAPATGIPAPYGRACSNCSRAKCRCIYRQDGKGCERCHRLQKDCRPSTPVRRRASGKKSSSAMLSRTAQLEQKLDGLVSLLTAQTNSHLREREATREGSAAPTAGTGTDMVTGTAHSCGSDSAAESSARGTPAASTSTSAGHGDFSVESRTLSAVNSDFRPVIPNGPEFGCGMMPQAIPPLTARIATSIPRRMDVPMPENGCAGLALGMGSMPRTPESSTSSTVPAPGGTRPFSKRHDQQPQQHHDSQSQSPSQGQPQGQPQNQDQNQQHSHTHQSQSSTSNFGWGFSYYPNTPKAPPKDPLNLEPELTPSPAEADDSFQTFRSTMLPFFPFVHLPSDLTAQQLRETRPYLWLSIMSMNHQRLPSHIQQARSTHLRGLFAQRVVVESEKSLDLLQSLLTFLTWIHYTSKRDRPTLSVMTQLAVSLVYDLGLHKFMAPCKSLIARLVRDHYQQASGPGVPNVTYSTSGAGTDDFPEPHAPSLDERRAALACYVLTSKFSLSLKRCDTLRWTSRMEEHLTEVKSKAVGPLDHVLVAQVRLQRVADFINQGEWQSSELTPVSALSVDCMALGSGGVWSSGVNEDNSRRLMPPFMAHVVRAKIEEIKDTIPPEVRHYEAVQDAIFAVDMVLCAAAVMPVIAPVLSMATITVVAIHSMNNRARSRFRRQQPPLQTREQEQARSQSQNQQQSQQQNQNQSQPQTQNQNQDRKQTPPRPILPADFARIAALERCVESVAAYWSFFQTITTASFAALPFAFFAHFTLCIVLLYGLTVVDEPLWDRAGVRDRLHVLDMLDGLIAKLGDARRITMVPYAGPDIYDVFSRAATMLGSVRELWAADMGMGMGMSREGNADDAEQETTVPAQQTTAQMTSAPVQPQRTMPPEMNMGVPPDAQAWQMPAMPPGGMPMMGPDDTAIGDAPAVAPQDPSLLLGPDGGVPPDLFSVMGLSEDYMFWDLFLPGGDGAPLV